MYAVIFIAEILELDDEYSRMATQMRDIAMQRYGCTEFVACTEGDREVAISYWQNEQDICQWKKDAQHMVAQKKGREKWYRHYRVQVAKITREYPGGD